MKRTIKRTAITIETVEITTTRRIRRNDGAQNGEEFPHPATPDRALLGGKIAHVELAPQTDVQEKRNENER